MIPNKFPKSFTPLWVIGERSVNSPVCVIYSPERGFYEPITNTDVENIIGKVLAWVYRDENSTVDISRYHTVINVVKDYAPDTVTVPRELMIALNEYIAARRILIGPNKIDENFGTTIAGTLSEFQRFFDAEHQLMRLTFDTNPLIGDGNAE